MWAFLCVIGYIAVIISILYFNWIKIYYYATETASHMHEIPSKWNLFECKSGCYYITDITFDDITDYIFAMIQINANAKNKSEEKKRI